MSNLFICPKAGECTEGDCSRKEEHPYLVGCDHEREGCGQRCVSVPDKPAEYEEIGDAACKARLAACYKEHWSTKLVEEGDVAIKAKFAELKASALNAYTPMELIIHLMSRTDCQVLKEIEYPNNQGIGRNYLYLEPNEFLVVLPADTKPALPCSKTGG